LLEKGIPWDVIHSLSVEDIAKLVGVMSALQEKQNRDQEDADRRMNNLTKGH
jgi:hypothetical protein|tara:strand:- start:625 stop:780 length:156 start_codon:yes stop_codon:yes gene_type:complete